MDMLGAGTYGSVVKEGKYAIKTFKKQSHLVREYCALSILKSDHIVKCHGYNLGKLSTKMDLYDGNLKNYLYEHKVSKEQKYDIILSIMLGLLHLHDRTISHADLKLDNILVKGKKVVLGDCGLSSNYKYCNIEDTARAYRDDQIVHDGKHDLYSLGICIYEIITDKKISKQVSSSKMLFYVKNNIAHGNTFRELLLRIFGPRDSRPGIREALHMIGYDNIPRRIEFDHLEVPERFKDMKINYTFTNGKYHGTFEDIFKEGMVRYNLQRARRSYYILTNIIGNRNVDYQEYISTMMYINRCLFTPSSESVLKNIKLNEDVFNDIVHSPYFIYIYITRFP